MLAGGIVNPQRQASRVLIRSHHNADIYVFFDVEHVLANLKNFGPGRRRGSPCADRCIGRRRIGIRRVGRGCGRGVGAGTGGGRRGGICRGGYHRGISRAKLIIPRDVVPIKILYHDGYGVGAGHELILESAVGARRRNTAVLKTGGLGPAAAERRIGRITVHDDGDRVVRFGGDVESRRGQLGGGQVKRAGDDNLIGTHAGDGRHFAVSLVRDKLRIAAVGQPSRVRIHRYHRGDRPHIQGIGRVRRNQISPIPAVNTGGNGLCKDKAKRL